MDYPWYELEENSSEIEQGDIIKGCPVPILQETDTITENKSVRTEILIINGIVLTQTCDIVNNKTENIIFCEITTKSEYEKIQKDAGKTENQIKKDLEGIINGRQHAYHIINKYQTEEFIQDYCIINFKNIYSVPINVARDFAKKNGKRLRLCPPYREHLSQAFARYFMRVGLPINIQME